MGATLEEMNSSMCAVNELEAALTQAKRKARQLEAEQKQLCQVIRMSACACGVLSRPYTAELRASDTQAAYDKLGRAAKEALPSLNRQLLASQQLEKTQRAFIEYQRAHDAHAEAKAVMALAEGQLMASSGTRQRCGAYASPCMPNACGFPMQGGAVVDTELLSTCSDLASRVVDAESAKLRADHVHAVEARCEVALRLTLARRRR